MVAPAVHSGARLMLAAIVANLAARRCHHCDGLTRHCDRRHEKKATEFSLSGFFLAYLQF
jgi:hypothetical protein